MTSLNNDTGLYFAILGWSSKITKRRKWIQSPAQQVQLLINPLKTRPLHLILYLLLNNQSHESVGGQLTVAGQMDFDLISKGCGYKAYSKANNVESLRQAWEVLKDKTGPCFLEIQITKIVFSIFNFGKKK